MGSSRILQAATYHRQMRRLSKPSGGRPSRRYIWLLARSNRKWMAYWHYQGVGFADRERCDGGGLQDGVVHAAAEAVGGALGGCWGARW